MKILLCHNSYVYRGGEDEVFEDERWLLESKGHHVVTYTRSNDSLANTRPVKAAINTLWNRSVNREVRELISDERPDVMHCHNTFPILSPAIYYAAKSHGVPVIQTLHNFRLLCPKAVLLRDNKICELCVGKRFAWSAVKHGCYRNSRTASLVTASMLALHRQLGTWESVVSKYIALTNFNKEKFVSAHIPSQKITVKPNFVRHDPGVGEGLGNYAIFVGRLSEEKGIDVLLDAWKELGADIPLKIVGEGPLDNLVRDAASVSDSIEWLGSKCHRDVMDLIAQAKVLVFPSIWFEGFGRCVIEAFSTGTPVIASDLGAMAELVQQGRNGLLFERSNVADLVKQTKRLLTDETLHNELRQASRKTFLEKYSASANYRQLMSIYESSVCAARTLQVDEVRPHFEKSLLDQSKFVSQKGRVE